MLVSDYSLSFTFTMPPPELMSCPVPGCEHKMREGLPNYDIMIRELEMHTRFGHANLAGAQGDPVVGGGVAASGAKPKELPRPTLEEDITEQEWNHFIVKWNRYKRSCLSRASDNHIVDQLRACCSEQLERMIYKQGVSETVTETALLATIKKMSVKKQNILLNIV